MAGLTSNDARAAKVAAVLIGVIAVVLSTVASPSDAYGASRWGNQVSGFATDASMGMSAPVVRLVDTLVGNQAVDDGSDNRLTVLAMGSDSRGSSLGRMDAILILSIKGNSISMASIPRDTARFPKRGGGVFSGKVNGIVRQYLNAGYSTQGALNEFEKDVENALGITIDYNAVVWFGGLTTLVGRVDPIYVSTREIRDAKLIDDHAANQPQGVYFPSSSSWALYDYNYSANGRAYCNGSWRFDPAPINAANKCKRALPFVRSRKGPNNDDWVRSKRQQNFIYRAIKAISSGELSGLASTASNEGGGKWITNMPISSSNAQDLYNRLHNASFSHSVVFKPTAYASRISGTSGYQLKLTAVRNWCNNYMS
jgi:anionic cell wall polymer biosynthesis LytR-Cps2A-Psr (LCP) family protein